MVLSLALASAHAYYCVFPGPSVALMTPEVVPVNAEVVVSYPGEGRRELNLEYPNGYTVRHQVRELDDRVVLEPLEELVPGEYFVDIQGAFFPLTVVDEVDETPPFPPDVVKVEDRRHHAEARLDGDFVVRLGQMETGTYTEVRFERPGEPPLTVLSTERDIAFGIDACNTTYPLGYTRSAVSPTFRVRSFDASGNVSDWVTMPSWPAPDPDAPGTIHGGGGCGYVSEGTVPTLRWLTRRR